MKVGDTIKCRDKFNMVDNMMQLAKNDIETEFVYEKDGVKGFWLEVVKVKYDG